MGWTDPRTWVTGDAVTAPAFNADLSDNLRSMGVWQPWPDMVRSTSEAVEAGAGMKTGRWCRVNDVVIAVGQVSWGTAGDPGTGTYIWTLPVPAAITYSAFAIVGRAVGWVASAFQSGTVSLNNNYTEAVVSDAVGTPVWADTAPGTWGLGADMGVFLQYEAA